MSVVYLAGHYEEVELFSNTYEKNKDALAFIIGHELGHQAHR